MVPAAGEDKQLQKYNYEHFCLKHFLDEICRTYKGTGVRLVY